MNSRLAPATVPASRNAHRLVLGAGALLGMAFAAYQIREKEWTADMAWLAPVAAAAGAALLWVLHPGAYARWIWPQSPWKTAVTRAARVDAWGCVLLLWAGGAVFFPAAQALFVLPGVGVYLLFKIAVLGLLAGALRPGLRSVVQGALVSVASLLVAYGVAEVGLRVYLEATQQTVEMLTGAVRSHAAGEPLTLVDLIVKDRNPRIVYSGRPGVAGVFQKSPLTQNSLGFRGREFQEAKPEGVFRIVGIGDSFMFGYGVGDDDTFLSHLERQLNRADTPSGGGPNAAARFEVLNLSCCGYNTIQEVETLRTVGLRFHPDLVIVQYYRNDILPPFLTPRTKAYLRAGGSVLFETLARRVRARARAEKTLDIEEAQRRKEQAVGLKANWGWADVAEEASPEDAPEEYRDMVGYGAVERGLKELGEISRRERIPIAVFALAAPGESVPRADWLAETAQKNGLFFHDTSAGLNQFIAASGKPIGKFRHDRTGFHHSALCSPVIADIIARQLDDWKLLPPRVPSSAPSGTGSGR